MALKMMHHSSDIMPNSFPPSRPSARDHGMLSDYEPHIIMRKTDNTSHKVEGGLPFDKDEAYPVIKKPQPTFKAASKMELMDLDPALCLTPEKPRKPSTHTERLKGGVGKDEGLVKSSQKVRFDQTVEVKQISPEVSVPQKNKDKRMTEAQEVSDSPITVTAKDHSHSSFMLDSPSPSLGSEEPLSIAACDVSNLRLSDEECMSDGSDDEVKAILKPSEDSDCVLARPEFNTLLIMNQEQKSLQALQPDAIQAAHKKLKESGRTKMKLDEKVATKLNLVDHQFESVIPLEVNKDDIVMGMNIKLKNKRDALSSSKAKPEDHITNPPDILDFFTPDLQWETASYDVGVDAYSLPGSRTADLDQTFDIYRHSRTWEGW